MQTLKSVLLLAVIPGLVLINGCSKSKGEAIVDDANLTECEAGWQCRYLYYNNARYSNGTITSGNDRLFVAASTTSSPARIGEGLLIKAPSSGSSFTLTSEDIAGGEKVTSYFSCPTCDYTATKPLGGSVKGMRVDEKRWLLEARVVLGLESNNKPVDTLHIKQYFNLSTSAESLF